MYCCTPKALYNHVGGSLLNQHQWICIYNPVQPYLQIQLLICVENSYEAYEWLHFLTKRVSKHYPLGNIIRKYGISFHCYADDTQLYISTRPDETSKLSKLTECVKNVKDWMTNNFLLLNSDKTEILLIGPNNSTQNLLDYNLQLDGCPVTSATVKNLGVILDSNLSFEKHISNVTKTAFFHLRNIAKLRNMLPVSDAEKLVHAFMTSRLDYCNALLGGCPASSINKLQVVQNAEARVLTRSRKYDHITPILQSLHWLPIKYRISYKILLLTYKALNGLAPAYLTSL